jgi:hypothetical protein
MSIVIREVTSKKDLRRFIHLPAVIHANHKNWLPPVYLDEWAFFNPEKNKCFAQCDTVLFLAMLDGIAVGRVMGIIHHPYNDSHSEKTARFFCLECFEDQLISDSLLEAVEKWALKKGMNRMIGPYGFSDKDPQGLMIEGFEYSPVLAAPCNEPYLVDYVQNKGYSKELDCFMFQFDIRQNLPESYHQIYTRVTANPVYKVLEFARKKDLKPYIIPILRMMNEAYAHIYGFVPLTEKEMMDMAKRYMPVIDPRFVKTIICAGEVVAFIIGLPNMTKGLQQAKGHLNPWSLFQIWLSARNTKKLDLMLGGVKPGFQGKGLEVLMGLRLFQSAREAGFTTFEVHLVLEQNKPMIAQMKKVGAIPHKRFRVFQKKLD